jgi:hypothetical protein
VHRRYCNCVWSFILQVLWETRSERVKSIALTVLGSIPGAGGFWNFHWSWSMTWVSRPTHASQGYQHLVFFGVGECFDSCFNKIHYRGHKTDRIGLLWLMLGSHIRRKNIRTRIIREQCELTGKYFDEGKIFYGIEVRFCMNMISYKDPSWLATSLYLYQPD